MREKGSFWFKKVINWVNVKTKGFFVSNEGICLALIIFFPLGLYLVWQKSNWNKFFKLCSTFVLLFVWILIIGDSITNSQYLATKQELVKTQESLAESQFETNELSDELDDLAEAYVATVTESEAYQKKMAPYEKLSEADAKKREADLKAEEEKAEKALADKEAAEKKKKEEEEAEQRKKEEEKKKQAEAAEKERQRVLDEEEARGYETGITFDQLARTPDDNLGDKVKFYGRVVQVIEDNGYITIRFAVNDDYDTVILGEYDSSIVTSRVLKDDYVTISGYSLGLTTYQSTMGGSITIPQVVIEKIEQ